VLQNNNLGVGGEADYCIKGNKFKSLRLLKKFQLQILTKPMQSIDFVMHTEHILHSLMPSKELMENHKEHNKATQFLPSSVL